MNIAIIFAGGVGRRMRSDAIPKQFLLVNDKPIIIHTLQIFQEHPDIDKIYISIVPSHYEFMNNLVKKYKLFKVKAIVNGGETSQDSIYNALRKANEENPTDSIVLIHDGVRPFIQDSVISANIDSVKKYGSAITCVPCNETIVEQNEKQSVKVLKRSSLYVAQAPQSFYLSEILKAHEIQRETVQRYDGLVDSCSIYYNQGKKVHFVNGNFGNIKVTTPEDVYILKGLLSYYEASKAFGL